MGCLDGPAAGGAGGRPTPTAELLVGVRPVSGFAELEGREGPEEDGTIGAELGGNDDLAGGGGGLTARCAVPFTFGFGFGLEGPAELGR